MVLWRVVLGAVGDVKVFGEGRCDVRTYRLIAQGVGVYSIEGVDDCVEIGICWAVGDADGRRVEAGGESLEARVEFGLLYGSVG